MSASKDSLPYKFVNDIPVPRLRSREDWPAWKEYIERTAKICGVWEFCDPAITEEQYLEQKVELWEPSYRTVREDAESLADLDDADFQKLQKLVKAYKANREGLVEKREAIDMIQQLIFASVSETFKSYTFEPTPYYQLAALSKIFLGPSADDINEMSSEWLALQQLVDSPDIQQYLTRWKALFKKCLGLKMSTGTQDQALGMSLLNSQDAATMWKPLQFQSWFVNPRLSEFDKESIDSWGMSPKTNTEGDEKSLAEDGEKSVIAWSSDAGEDPDDVGDATVDSWTGATVL
ncbi:hypothetical protein F1880_005753 [Penicillium rolfsii]|nr:hypothetical protein F1880_005753 [Penicillium rolfsii]